MSRLAERTRRNGEKYELPARRIIARREDRDRQTRGGEVAGHGTCLICPSLQLLLLLQLLTSQTQQQKQKQAVCKTITWSYDSFQHARRCLFTTGPQHPGIACMADVSLHSNQLDEWLLEGAVSCLVYPTESRLTKLHWQKIIIILLLRGTLFAVYGTRGLHLNSWGYT